MEEMLNLHGCVVKDERGMLLANLYKDHYSDRIRVVRYPSCSIGMYFHIMSLLLDLGYNVK